MKLPAWFCSLTLFAAAISPAASAGGDTYKFDQSGSIIGFSVHQFFGTARGTFKRFEGKIRLDAMHPEQSSVRVTIQAASIDTGIATRDKHLRGPEFFNAAKYPNITFQSRKVWQTGKESAQIMGDLTMHGTTKPIMLRVKLMTPLTARSALSHTRWEVVADPIKRSDFGLIWSPSVEMISRISQEVVPRIQIEAVPTEQRGSE
jgi:polyisoprenoid-binding protein YceI